MENINARLELISSSIARKQEMLRTSGDLKYQGLMTDIKRLRQQYNDLVGFQTKYLLVSLPTYQEAVELLDGIREKKVTDVTPQQMAKAILVAHWELNPETIWNPSIELALALKVLEAGV